MSSNKKTEKNKKSHKINIKVDFLKFEFYV